MADTMISASGGLSKMKLALATAAESDVLSGKRFYAGSKVIKEGRMPNRGSISATLDPDSSKYYSAGYYSGGTIICNSVTSVIKTTTLQFVTDNDSPCIRYAPGTIVGVKSMWRASGDSNVPVQFSISGNSMSVWWDQNGALNVSFTVAYI